MTGSVTSVSGVPFGISTSVGEPIVVKTVYDLGVADAVGSPTFGSYSQTLLDGFSITVGEHLLRSSDYVLSTFWGSIDGFVVDANDFFVDDVYYNPVDDFHTRMDITLNNNNGDSFSDDSLPFSFDISKHAWQNTVIQQSPLSSGLASYQSIQFSLTDATFDYEEPLSIVVNNVAPVLSALTIDSGD